MATEGYNVKKFDVPVKRYCQVLDLKDDPQLMAEYVKQHSEEGMWPEIVAGIREVGILEMELYLVENRLVMIVETPLDFDWDSAMKRLDTLPRQSEWEAHVGKYQVCKEGSTSDEKWKMMQRIFHLYEYNKRNVSLMSSCLSNGLLKGTANKIKAIKR